MKHVPYSNSNVNNTNTNVPIVTNTPVHNALPVNNTNHSVYPPPHTVNTSVNNLLFPTAHTVNTPSTTPLITPTYLYDLLTPHLLHQHSLRTAVHDLLLPLPPTLLTPIPTLTILHPASTPYYPHYPRPHYHVPPLYALLRAPPPYPMLTH